MEFKATCKTWTATHQLKNGFLGWPYHADFSVPIKNEMVKLHCEIEQGGIRTIKLSHDTDVEVSEMYSAYLSVEKLLMLFDGFFVPLASIVLTDSDDYSKKDLDEVAKQCTKSRSLYYSSCDFCYLFNPKLVDFSQVLTDAIYKKWFALENELSIAHQLLLCNLSDNGLPVDIRVAFSIELAEMLVELVKSRTHFFTTFEPGSRGTSLKMCLDAIITRYGNDIFRKELAGQYNDFLQILVNSRVRVMHIKRNQKGLCLNGPESILYSMKFFFLYRIIIFELLGIPYLNYQQNLAASVNKWNDWDGIFDSFQSKHKLA